ncbi:hypothetical protein GCM10012279_14060 [Micromonospora yangpuensis]|nr:hypothetical protein GCM10012279_14060 [Micromonospora yangpuensis]
MRHNLTGGSWTFSPYGTGAVVGGLGSADVPARRRGVDQPQRLEGGRSFVIILYRVGGTAIARPTCRFNARWSASAKLVPGFMQAKRLLIAAVSFRTPYCAGGVIALVGWRGVRAGPGGRAGLRCCWSIPDSLGAAPG